MSTDNMNSRLEARLSFENQYNPKIPSDMLLPIEVKASAEDDWDSDDDNAFFVVGRLQVSAPGSHNGMRVGAEFRNDGEFEQSVLGARNFLEKLLTTEQPSIIKLSILSDSVTVKSPYDSDFVGAARSIDGKWDRALGLWVFPLHNLDDVRQIMMTYYHTTGDSPVVKIKVTVSETLSQRTGPVCIGPVPVARAFGRDSGAKPINGACFIAGRPDSGGSIKNWCTVVPEGSVFTIKVPRDLAEYLVDCYADDETIEIGHVSAEQSNTQSTGGPETADEPTADEPAASVSRAPSM